MRMHLTHSNAPPPLHRLNRQRRVKNCTCARTKVRATVIYYRDWGGKMYQLPEHYCVNINTITVLFCLFSTQFKMKRLQFCYFNILYAQDTFYILHYLLGQDFLASMYHVYLHFYPEEKYWEISWRMILQNTSVLCVQEVLTQVTVGQVGCDVMAQYWQDIDDRY